MVVTRQRSGELLSLSKCQHVKGARPTYTPLHLGTGVQLDGAFPLVNARIFERVDFGSSHRGENLTVQSGGSVSMWRTTPTSNTPTLTRLSH